MYSIVITVWKALSVFTISTNATGAHSVQAMHVIRVFRRACLHGMSGYVSTMSDAAKSSGSTTWRTMGCSSSSASHTASTIC